MIMQVYRLLFLLIIASAAAAAGSLDTNSATTGATATGNKATVCTLPINFTYYQRKNGYYCKLPNKFLENIYGGSFSQPTGGIARRTKDPNVRFRIVEVSTWQELATRMSQLDQGVAKYGTHTPALFWDGRNDVYWHKNNIEDTITTKFKPFVDAYIARCTAANKQVEEVAAGAGEAGAEAGAGDEGREEEVDDDDDDELRQPPTVPAKKAPQADKCGSLANNQGGAGGQAKGCEGGGRRRRLRLRGL